MDTSDPESVDTHAQAHAHARNLSISVPQSLSTPSNSHSQPHSPKENKQPKTKKARTLACGFCRKRKLKCDRQVPVCGSCKARNKPDQCTYTEDRTDHNPPPEPAPAPLLAAQAAQPIHQRVDRLEAILSRALSQLQFNPVPPPPHQSGRSPNKLALANHITSSILYPSFWAALGGPSCAEAVFNALSIYPDKEMVRTCIQSYFNSVGDWFAVVSPPIFWQKFFRHQRFVQDVRTRGITSSGDRSDVEFLTLVLALTLAGFVYSVDSRLHQSFRHMYRGRPMHTFVGAIHQLLLALEHRSKPTIETVRVELITFLVLPLSSNLWSPCVNTAGIVQSGVAVQLNLDPPQDSTVEEYYDHMRLWVCLTCIESFGSLEARRAPMINLDEPKPTPTFLYTNQRVWPNDHSGFSASTIMYRFALARFCMRGAKRAALYGEEAAYAQTLKLQEEFDRLHASLPPDLQAAFATPQQQATRRVFCTYFCMLFKQYTLMSLHHPFYVQGWRDSDRKRSVEMCYLAAKEWVKIFLEFCVLYAPHLPLGANRNLAGLNQEGPWYSVPSQIEVCMPLAMSILALLRHHMLLSNMHPDQVVPTDKNERDEVQMLLKQMDTLAEIVNSPTPSPPTTSPPPPHLRPGYEERSSTLPSAPPMASQGSIQAGPRVPGTASPLTAPTCSRSAQTAPAFPRRAGAPETYPYASAAPTNGTQLTNLHPTVSAATAPSTSTPPLFPTPSNMASGPSTSASFENCTRAVPQIQPLLWRHTPVSGGNVVSGAPNGVPNGVQDPQLWDARWP